MKIRGEIREGVQTSVKGKSKVWGSWNDSKKVAGLKSETNLEEGRRHQKIQITCKVCDQSASQRLKSPLPYGTRVMEKSSYGETRSVQEPNHSGEHRHQ